MTRDRIDWIDAAKRIGISLVVIGHAQIPDDLRTFIFSFHVPLFFFLSGILSTKTTLNFQEFFLKKVKSLLIPYFSFSFLFLLYMFVRVQTHTIENVDIYRYLAGVFYSIGVDNWMIVIPLWFLPCLFTVELLFHPIKKVKNSQTIVIILIISSVLGYVQTLFYHPRLPWSLEISLTALVFFGVGYLCSSFKQFLAPKNSLVRLGGLIVSFLVVVAFVNPTIDMNHNELGRYYDFYIAAFAGIALSILLSQYLSSSFLLKYIGRNTLVILATHGFVLALTEKIITKIPVLNSANLIGISSFILTIVLLIPCIYVINRYFPILTGRLPRHTAINDKTEEVS